VPACAMCFRVVCKRLDGQSAFVYVSACRMKRVLCSSALQRACARCGMRQVLMCDDMCFDVLSAD